MSFLISVVLPVFLIVGAAVVAHARLKFHAPTLSRAAFYLFSPMLIFDSLVTSTATTAEFGQIALVALATTAIMWILGTIAARPLRLEGPTQAAFILSLLLMNAGNFGLSVNLFAFGQPGVDRAAVYFTISAALSSSLGVYLSARGRAPARMALRQAAGVPLVYAAILGLAVNLTGLPMPEPVMKAAHTLGQAAVPTMLAVLGLRLVETLQDERRSIHWPAIAVVTVGRLVVAPLIALGLATLIGLQGLTFQVTVLETAMPTAVITTILATEFDSDPSFASVAALATTVASLPTITLWLNLLSG